jgi:indole-3-glycerol phosphate synthase
MKYTVPAFSRWSPPGGTLGAITREAEKRAELLLPRLAEFERACAIIPAGPSLRVALQRPDVAVLAEVKRRSPSAGAIAPRLDAVGQAQAYAEGGAAAVSILTERDHFGGAVEDLVAVRSQVNIAVLKKDFHVAPVQLVEARALGASAALLIVRALAPERLPEMMRAGAELGLELLVEIRDEEELERALAAGATMIGVNNRDLETLEIEPDTAKRVLPRIPPGVVAVAESGVKSRADVERYGVCGADAVLVGSLLSASADPAAATRALTGVPRRRRDG